MRRKVGMVHVMSFNVRLFNELISEIMSDVEVVHLVDEGLQTMVGEHSRGNVIRRLRTLVSFAEESGAEVVLLTCTALGSLVDEVSEAVSVPVMSVLEILVDEAMSVSNCIGILGTNPATLASASQIIKELDVIRRKKTEVKTQLCPGALDALRRDDMETHDGIILEHVDHLMDEVSVIVIPQPSMERVINKIAEASRRIPVLSGAYLSVRRLKDSLGGGTAKSS